MAKVACILGAGFEDSEFRKPFDAFRNEGHEVVIISRKQGETLQGMHGKETAKADLSIDDAEVDDYDLLFIPGGYSPDNLRADDRFVNFVRDFDRTGKTIAAICHGPWVLCSRLLPQGETPLKGRKVTCFHSIKDDVQNAGEVYVDQEVCIDGNIITSRTPEDLPAFVVALMGMMQKG